MGIEEDLAAEEQRLGIGAVGAEAAPPAQEAEIGPVHVAGALKQSGIEYAKALGAPMGAIGMLIPGDNFLTRAWETHKRFYNGLAKEDPDVQDYLKAVENKTEPFVGEWLGSLGPTAAAIQYAALPGGTIASFGTKLSMNTVSGLVTQAPRFTLTIGKVLSTAMFYKLNQEEIYDMAKAEGAEEKYAKAASVVGGALSTMGDVYGLEGILGTFRGKALGNLLTTIGIATVSEGMTEGMQGALGYVAKEWAKGKSQGETSGKFAERMLEKRGEIWEAARHDALIGGASGLFFGVGGVVGGVALATLAPAEAQASAPPPPSKTSPSAAPPANIEQAIAGDKVYDYLRKKDGETDTAWHTRLYADMKENWDQTWELSRERDSGRAFNAKAAEWQEKFAAEEAEIERQAAAQAAAATKATLGPGAQEEMRTLSSKIAEEGKIIKDATDAGRHVTGRMQDMIERHTAELARLKQREDEIYQNWHNRIAKNMRAQIGLDDRFMAFQDTLEKIKAEGRAEAEPQTYMGSRSGAISLANVVPSPVETHTLPIIQPGETFLDDATRRVGGVPGVREIVPLRVDLDIKQGGLIDIPPVVRDELLQVPGAYAGARETMAVMQAVRQPPPITYSKGMAVQGAEQLDRRPGQKYVVANVNPDGGMVARMAPLPPGELGPGQVAVNMEPSLRELSNALPDGQKLGKLEVSLGGGKVAADEALHDVDRRLSVLDQLSQCILK